MEQELASQPGIWTAAAALATSAPLPAPGARVCVIGCGTSCFMAQAYAALRERAGHGWTDAFAASELPAGRRYDVLVALSRSGTTTEVVHALGRGLADRSVAITGDVAAPVGAAADAAIGLPFADERSIVQTRFATGALSLLRESLQPGAAAVAAADAERALREPLPVADPAAIEQWTFLGPRLDRRAGAGGGAQAARERAGLDRGVPAVRVPPRADQHRRARPRHLVARPARPGGRGRAARHRGDRRGGALGPARRARPGAAGRGRAGPRARAGPRPSSQPDPLGPARRARSRAAGVTTPTGRKANFTMNALSSLRMLLVIAALACGVAGCGGGGDDDGDGEAAPSAARRSRSRSGTGRTSRPARRSSSSSRSSTTRRTASASTARSARWPTSCCRR